MKHIPENKICHGYADAIIAGRVAFLLFVVIVSAFVLQGCLIPTQDASDRFLKPEKDFPALPKTPYEEVTFQGKDGAVLHGWFISAGEGKPVILICPDGNGNRSRYISAMTVFRDAGFSTFCFDYRGFGESTERKNIKYLIEDAVAAFDYVSCRRDVNQPAQVGIFGDGIGSMVAIAVASRRPEVRGLACESLFSPYKSLYPEIKKKYRLITIYPLGMFITRLSLPFGSDPKYMLKKVRCPLLVLQGRDDDMISLGLCSELFAAANQPKRFLWHDDYRPTDTTKHDIRSTSEVAGQLSSFFKNCFEDEKGKFTEEWRILEWDSHILGKWRAKKYPDTRFDFFEKPQTKTAPGAFMVTVTYERFAKEFPDVESVPQITIFTQYGIMRETLPAIEEGKRATGVWVVPGKPTALSITGYRYDIPENKEPSKKDGQTK